MNSVISRLTFLAHCLIKRNYCTTGKDAVVTRSGVKYFKRSPNEEEITCKSPPKLFMVTRVKPYKGTPYWERQILEELGLMIKIGDVAIVKNIPEMNSKLWKIKHLIKITPITFPNGIPSKDDIGSTYLKENGELLVAKRLNVNTAEFEASTDFAYLKSRMDPKTLRKYLRLKWINPYV